MTLKKLLNKQFPIVLGLNSGTSADGLDMAVLQFSNSKTKSSVFISGGYCPYPKILRDNILKVSDSKSVSLDTIIYLHNFLGEFYGANANRMIGKLKRNGIEIDLIASHGQTVRHLPGQIQFLLKKVHGTLQLGSLEHISAITGKTVIGDFRQADIALHNEGAPITVAAMASLFSHPKQPRLIINIGGMANYFYFPAVHSHEKIRAADCGPGNSLSDILCQKLFGKSFDKNGRFASQGIISPKLLNSILQNPFFNGKISSTGREVFGEPMADKLLILKNKYSLSPFDLIATVIEATVFGIHRAIKPFIHNRSLTKIYLTGGGVHNSFLVRRLNETLKPINVESIAELGFDPDLVEACSYATMGLACLRSEPMPTVFKAGKQQLLLPVLGKIVQPPVKRV
jgi:anhydro-N-acetylmuramic acid kinase